MPRSFVERIARKTHKKHIYVLDGFDNSWYLYFDFTPIEEDPDGTHCDVMIQKVGEPPCDGLCLKSHCATHDISRILAAIGISRFSEKVKKAFYDSHNILRAQ